MTIKQVLESSAWKAVLWIAGAVVVLLIAFKAGEFVGYSKAGYSYRWGENVYRTYMGPRFGGGMMNGGGMMGGFLPTQDFLAGHGVAGPVLRVAMPTFVVQDRDGAEKIVEVTSSTAIRYMHSSLSAGELVAGMSVMVIGSPDASGVIEARLIRVLPSMMQGYPSFAQ